MATKYTHQELDKEVRAISGYYTPLKEVRLKYDGKEVLYVVGYVSIEASCCGASSWTYVLVPGYVMHWQKERNANNMLVTDVEPVTTDTDKDAIRKLIREAEKIQPVEFW